MELFQLRYFSAVAHQGSFTRAAESLYVAQPSLSQQIAKLETELGTRLFTRRGRTISLTDAGTVLLGYADRILALEAEAQRGVQQVVGLDRGRLMLCGLPALDQQLLPPWLAEFRQAHPGIELRVRELRPSRAIARAVLSGEADLGFVHLPCQAEGLEVRPILEEPLLLVAPTGHRFQGRDCIALEEARDEDWVWVHEAQDDDHPLYSACVRAGFRPRIVCESGSAQGVVSLVRAGLGIALLPRMAIDLRAGIHAISLIGTPSRTLAVVWPVDRLSPAAEVFLRICLTNADGAGSSGPTPASQESSSTSWQKMVMPGLSR